ncbi:MAG: FAD-binding oxidoreductase [Candidatus Helarchaeota archaeon]
MASIIDDLVNIVGDKHVSDEEAVVIPYSRDQHWPFVVPKRPAVVVRPITTEEIQEILKFANERKIPVVPLSRGVNVRGLCTPARDGSILLDLRRMNKILEVNEDMMSATIQPGVTHGQLAIAARKNNMRPCIPGAPATGSLLANYLLRGVYHTNAGDGIDHILSAEFVLPDGRLLKTGAMAFPNAPPHFRFTCSPDLVGVFQSMPGSIAVCTKMTIKLYPLPEFERWFLLGYNKIEDAIKPIPPLMRHQIAALIWVLPQFTIAKLIAQNRKELDGLRGTFPEYTLPIVIEGHEKIVNAKAELAMELIHKVAPPEFGGKKPLPLPDNFMKEFMYPRRIFGFLREGSYHALAFHGPLYQYPKYIKMMKEEGVKAGYKAENVDLLAAPVGPIFWGQGMYYEMEVPYTSADKKSVEMVKTVHYAVLKKLITKEFHIYGWFRPFLNPMKLVMDDLGVYGEIWRNIMKLIDPNEIMNPDKVFPEEKELTW